jgi:hypothetical protein
MRAKRRGARAEFTLFVVVAVVFGVSFRVYSQYPRGGDVRRDGRSNVGDGVAGRRRDPERGSPLLVMLLLLLLRPKWGCRAARVATNRRDGLPRLGAKCGIRDGRTGEPGGRDGGTESDGAETKAEQSKEAQPLVYSLVIMDEPRV